MWEQGRERTGGRSRECMHGTLQVEARTRTLAQIKTGGKGGGVVTSGQTASRSCSPVGGTPSPSHV